MNPETDAPGILSDLEEKLDDPYIQIVSTEEFVEAAEQASQDENNERLISDGQ